VELGWLGVLQIEKVVSSDQGTYRCVASNEARERRSNDAHLIVNTDTQDDTGQFSDCSCVHSLAVIFSSLKIR